MEAFSKHHVRSGRGQENNKNNEENDSGLNLVTSKSEGIILFLRIWLKSLLAKGDHWLKVTIGQRALS